MDAYTTLIEFSDGHVFEADETRINSGFMATNGWQQEQPGQWSRRLTGDYVLDNAVVLDLAETYGVAVIVAGVA
jgi:hypothetical protein